MLAKLKNFFDQHLDPAQPNQDPQQSLQLATAALFIEMARADFSIDEVEQKRLKNLLNEQFDLDAAQLEELMSLANSEVENASSLYQFTRLINDNYKNADKLILIEQLWQVAYADGEISKYEESLLRKVCDLLYVSHSDFIACKHKARAKLHPPG